MTNGSATKPIIFSGPRVRAILDGTKTQTRRPIKSDWARCLDLDGDLDDRLRALVRCPFGKPGGRLWVRETWAPQREGHTAYYRADAGTQSQTKGWFHAIQHDGQWRPSIHMPRWASRITLEVTDVRVERLQAISPGDTEEEGFGCGVDASGQLRFAWDGMYAKRKPELAWDANPWVWAVTFKRVPQP